MDRLRQVTTIVRSSSVRWAIVIVLLAMGAGQLEAAPSSRVWTDRQGKQVKARFVRMHDGKVVLNRSGRILKLSPNQLSDEDQEYLKALEIESDLKKKGDGYRTWTDRGGRWVNAQFGDLKEGKVRLVDGEDEKTIPFKKLSPVDQEYVRQQYGDVAARELPPTSTPRQDEPERSWSDRSGKSITAVLVRYSNGEIVLKKNEDYRALSWSKLSKADQRYVRKQLTAQGEGKMLPVDPPPTIASKPQNSRSSAKRSSSNRSTGTGRSRSEQMLAEQRARDRRREKQRAEARRREEAKLREKERQYQKLVEERMRTNSDLPQHGFTLERRCSQCNQVVTGNYCPNCNSSHSRRPSGGEFRHWARLILAIVVGLCSFAGWIWRKMRQ